MHLKLIISFLLFSLIACTENKKKEQAVEIQKSDMITDTSSVQKEIVQNDYQLESLSKNEISKLIGEWEMVEGDDNHGWHTFQIAETGTISYFGGPCQSEMKLFKDKENIKIKYTNTECSIDIEELENINKIVGSCEIEQDTILKLELNKYCFDFEEGKYVFRKKQ